MSVSSSCLRKAAICFLIICSNVGFGSLSSVARRTRAETLHRSEISALRGTRKDVQSFFQVREAEVVCEVCDFIPKRIGEWDVLVVYEFLLPILNVQNSLVAGRDIEQA